MYTAGIAARAEHGPAAQILIDLLTGGEAAQLRAQAGFLDT